MERRKRERLRDWVLGQRTGKRVEIQRADLIELLDYIDELEGQAYVPLDDAPEEEQQARRALIDSLMGDSNANRW